MPATYAIIVAGGTGTRMKSSVPKQFLELSGEPVLMHAVRAFSRFDTLIQIRIVLPETLFPQWEELCRKHDFRIPHWLIPGGDTRTGSVRNALQDIKGEGLVAIHDGVRPLVPVDLIRTAFDTAGRTGNAVPAIPVPESVRQITEEGNEPVSRDSLRIIQTPQVFDLSLIKNAYDLAGGEDFTDDATVFELLGKEICLIEGSRQNIKITLPEDLAVAEALLSQTRPG